MFGVPFLGVYGDDYNDGGVPGRARDRIVNSFTGRRVGGMGLRAGAVPVLYGDAAVGCIYG